ncbi:hypothetical protein [Saccharobesus litoralis]|uniref:hypothetical protein n=1 Tax=Saccharobesus litoralis TaxID=2172099 RepID=UPI00131ED98C|nr:hypothetical protein [Saccharobesus litoralis]
MFKLLAGLIVCYLYLAITSCVSAQVLDINIATSRYHSTKYLHMTNSVPCYQQQYQALTSPYRGAVEIHLLCQLLNAGGLKSQFRFIPAFDYQHAEKLVLEGKAHMMGETSWSNLINEGVEKSDAIYRKNEYLLGLYTTPEKALNIKIETLEDFKSLTGVSNQFWVNDWQLLNKLPLRKRLSKRTAFQMFSIVKRGYADFVLWPFYFHAADFSYTISPIENYPEDHFKLEPIRNIKLSIPYSRHYIVTKQSNTNNAIIQAINLGITRFRLQGKIRQFYLSSGYFNQEVDQWPNVVDLIDLHKAANNQIKPN